MPSRILMVDDEPYNLDILRIYLKSMNYDVYEAVNGEDAIQMVERVNPDLILLDVMLPDISGYDVCKRLKEHTDFDIPIIFLSANTSKDDILRGLELGVFDYLTKPFDLELLEKKLNIALQHRKNYRRELIQRLEIDLEQAKLNRSVLSFMIAQIDQIDMIYDSFGQNAVDLLFQSINSRLRESDIPINTISRRSSDKILVILPDLYGTQVLSEEMEKIIHVLSGQPFIVQQTEIFITASIGICAFPFDGEDVETLIKNAEMATHTAKRSGGGNKFKFYSSDMDGHLTKRIKMESKLRRALERQEFTLHYQPKINIHTGKLIGSEALIRWNDPEWGMVSPLEFIPIAEEIGLIHALGKWVLLTACEQNKQWNEAGFPDLTVAVNLSSRQLENPDFLQSLLDILAYTEMDPKLLEIEITEGVLLQNVSETMYFLNALKGKGIHISIDDFGTGYSSLSYLKKFPITCLKIDRSFIKDIIHDSDNTEITNAIISLAHTLNLKVIAEGVETEEQLDYLKQKQCDEVQGYYFSKPLSSLDFGMYISNLDAQQSANQPDIRTTSIAQG